MATTGQIYALRLKLSDFINTEFESGRHKKRIDKL